MLFSEVNRTGARSLNGRDCSGEFSTACEFKSLMRSSCLLIRLLLDCDIRGSVVFILLETVSERVAFRKSSTNESRIWLFRIA